MVRLYPAQLSESGRPTLLKGEVERGLLDKVDLVFEGLGGVPERPSAEYKGGYVVLTNFRLIWLTPQAAPAAEVAGAPCHLPLPAVSYAEHKAGLLFKAPRLKLSVRVDERGFPAADARSVARVALLLLVCRGPSPDTWFSQLQGTISRQAWAAAPPGLLQQLHPTPPPGSEDQLGPLGAAQVVHPSRSQQQQQQQQPAGAGGQRPASGLLVPAGFQPDAALVQGLCSMGYAPLRAVNACIATNNAGSQQALEWLMDHEGSLLADAPNAFVGSNGQLVELGPAASSSSDWSMGSSQMSSGFSRQLSLGSVGVAGVLRREEQRAIATGHSLDQAFSDLRQLMAKAEEMVQLAEQFRERMAAKRAAVAAASGAAGAEASMDGGEGEELDAATALDLVNLGIVSPVTKVTAGTLYYTELSRQLADFLKGPVECAGGMMPLPDVYCLYNRARGTELVSPDDLLQAVTLFPQIRAQMQLREFASGVKVVQGASHSDERICQRLAELVRPRQQPSAAAAAAAVPAPSAASIMQQGGGAGAAEAQAGGEQLWLESLGPALTRNEAADALGVPLAVASEQLAVAEARGLLCRDEGPEGLRYFRNFFADAAAVAAR